MATESLTERLREITWRQYAFVAACSVVTYGLVYAAATRADDDADDLPLDASGGLKIGKKG
jgi:hypothetical protein